MATNTTPNKQLLRMADVCKLLSLSRSTLYEKISRASPRFDKTFPRPIKLSSTTGSSAIAFLASSIDDWIQGRIDASEGK